jgi:hypothetical protein
VPVAELPLALIEGVAEGAGGACVLQPVRQQATAKKDVTTKHQTQRACMTVLTSRTVR